MSYGVVVGYFVSYEVVARHFANHGGELLISCVRRRRSKLRGCIVFVAPCHSNGNAARAVYRSLYGESGC